MEDETKIRYYFLKEKKFLLIITVTGIVYNVGMIAGPWFEGQLVQMFFDIMKGEKTLKNMLIMCIIYIFVIAFVQIMRFYKRLYVRKFANHINKNMKERLYGNIINQTKNDLEKEGIGNLMTKAIADVDTCVEGMRKFTTEVFDTGVVMISYIVMLLIYDYRLALISFVFPPIAYFMAEKLKKVVAKTASEYKESAGKLNSATLNRVNNAITYRVYGQEDIQNLSYEKRLKDYEKKAIYANLWENTMQPLYQMISMMSIFFILWFGIKNVKHIGFTNWDIAAFTTFIACYTKLAVKSSKAAKLFNSVQKARVSWERIKPFMKGREYNKKGHAKLKAFVMENVSVKNINEESKYLFENVCLEAYPGEIIGVTGIVASGKSTFGRTILGEVEYDGNIMFNGKCYKYDSLVCNNDFVGYMGHDPELLCDTVKNNICLGQDSDIMPYLEVVCMDEEVSHMENGMDTVIGNGGIRLSGGQQARIALARTLYHKRPVIVLDDPFSAVDRETEMTILDNIRRQFGDVVIFIISHRLEIFGTLDKVIWLDNGKMIVSNHRELMETNEKYKELYDLIAKDTKCS